MLSLTVFNNTTFFIFLAFIVPTSSEISFSLIKEKRFLDPSSAIEDSKKVNANSRELLSNLLGAFDNFQPIISTSEFSGFFSVPYLVSFFTSLISLHFFCFQPRIAIIFLISSIILNTFALVFDILLFFWVFDLITKLPGIKEQIKGPGIFLAIFSLFFLFISFVLTLRMVLTNKKTKIHRVSGKKSSIRA